MWTDNSSCSSPSSSDTRTWGNSSVLLGCVCLGLCGHVWPECHTSTLSFGKPNLPQDYIFPILPECWNTKVLQSLQQKYFTFFWRCQLSLSSDFHRNKRVNTFSVKEPVSGAGTPAAGEGCCRAQSGYSASWEHRPTSCVLHCGKQRWARGETQRYKRPISCQLGPLQKWGYSAFQFKTLVLLSV